MLSVRIHGLQYRLCIRVDECRSTALATSSPVGGDIATEWEGAPKLFQRSVAFSTAVVLGKVIVV